jgi:hypothetical protein
LFTLFLRRHGLEERRKRRENLFSIHVGKFPFTALEENLLEDGKIEILICITSELSVRQRFTCGSVEWAQRLTFAINNAFELDFGGVENGKNLFRGSLSILHKFPSFNQLLMSRYDNSDSTCPADKSCGHKADESNSVVSVNHHNA